MSGEAVQASTGPAMGGAAVPRRLEDKVALITGTGGGQGRAAAVRFAAEGALVIGCDVSAQGNDETVAMVRQAGGAMTGMAPVDLSDHEQARAWVDEAAAVHGRIDVLFNNASAVKFAPMPDMSVADWQYTIQNELDLVFYVTKFAWPYLARRGGVILSTASISGYIPNKGQGDVAHCAAKGGVVVMSKAFAVDGAPHGIRAVSISPGPIKTPSFIKWTLTGPEVEQTIIDQLLVDRLGVPKDVAALAAFLASDEASFINGADILIDGGFCATGRLLG